MPAEDLVRCGCAPHELSAAAGAAGASEPLRALIAFEVRRARGLIAQGAPLIDELRGRERIAVAAFVAGGRAALDAIERARYDVLAGAPRASGRRRLLALGAVLVEGRRRRAARAAQSVP